MVEEIAGDFASIGAGAAKAVGVGGLLQVKGGIEVIDIKAVALILRVDNFLEDLATGQKGGTAAKGMAHLAQPAGAVDAQ